MSLFPDQVARLAWDDSLGLAGVTYVEHNLARLAGVGRSSCSALRRTVSSIATDLALRRLLDHEGLPYTLLEGEPFTRPSWPRIIIGGRRLHLETRLLSSRRAIRRIRTDPGTLRDIPVSLPRKEIDRDAVSEGDLLAFALLLGLETRTLTDHRRAVAKGLPIHLLAQPPEPDWSQPSVGFDLGEVCVTGPPGPIDLVIQGVLTNQEPWRASVALEASSFYRSPSLHALTAIHTLTLPEGPIVFTAESRAASWRLHPGGWGNIWVYGMEILVLGWTTVGEFRRTSASSSLPRVSRLGALPSPGGYSALANSLRPLRAAMSHLRQP